MWWNNSHIIQHHNSSYFIYSQTKKIPSLLMRCSFQDNYIMYYPQTLSDNDGWLFKNPVSTIGVI